MGTIAKQQKQPSSKGMTVGAGRARYAVDVSDSPQRGREAKDAEEGRVGGKVSAERCGVVCLVAEEAEGAEEDDVHADPVSSLEGALAFSRSGNASFPNP